MQSFLTVLGYQFIHVFTEYWCKQMPKLPVIFKICRDDWYSGYWLQNHRKLSGAVILPVGPFVPLPQATAKDALTLTQLRAHTLTRLANDVQLSSPLPSLAHQRPRSYVDLSWGRGRKKKHNSRSTRFDVYSSVCLLKGADPFCSLGLWTKSRAAASTVIRDTTERFTLPTTRRPLTLPYFQHQREDFPLLSPVYNVLSKFLGFNKAIDK